MVPASATLSTDANANDLVPPPPSTTTDPEAAPVERPAISPFAAAQPATDAHVRRADCLYLGTGLPQRLVWLGCCHSVCRGVRQPCRLEHQRTANRIFSEPALWANARHLLHLKHVYSRISRNLLDNAVLRAQAEPGQVPPEGGEAARAFSSALQEEHPSRAPPTFSKAHCSDHVITHAHQLSTA